MTFRTGNLGSYGNERYEHAISTKLERAWEGKALPEFFVIGKREEGGTVYQAQKTPWNAEWVDANPLPGNAEPIGYLTKISGRFRVVLETKDERRERTDREAAEQTSGANTWTWSSPLSETEEKDLKEELDMVPMAWD